MKYIYYYIIIITIIIIIFNALPFSHCLNIALNYFIMTNWMIYIAPYGI